MRFVWAVAAFVLAALMIGAGIAQRTVFQGPKTETAAVAVDEGAAFVLIDGAVLNKLPGAQSLRVQGTGSVFASYGRTADLKAWLAGSEYDAVSLGSDGALVTTAVSASDGATAAPGATPAPTPTATATPAASAPAAGSTTTVSRNPVGSDLWLDEFQQDGELVAPLQLPVGMSVLVASDGTAPAPTDVSVSWPIGNATPWAGPLIVGGGVLMAAGVLLYILGIRHVRRSRGPRRKGLPLPVTEPIDLAVEGEAKGVISAGPTRRSLSGGRRALVAVPMIAVAGLVLAGCSADAWPNLAGSPTPSPSASVIVPDGQQSPAVSRTQAQRILTRIADTVAQADQAHDQALASTRLDGAMLAARTTAYKLAAAAVEGAKMPAAIASQPLQIVLPQAFDAWPRSVLVVVDGGSGAVPIMTMSQKDPWSAYKLSYSADLEASAKLPDVAAEYVGATQVPPESDFLRLKPVDVATAYADIITNGTASKYYGEFDMESDAYFPSVVADRQKRLDEFNQTAATTGSMTFSAAAGATAPVALATLESGAIVAVNVSELETIKPTTADAVIKLGGNLVVRALVGADESATGVTTTYGDQLFFYVPGQSSSEKIRLLGTSSSILDSKVNP
ncbi:glycosyl transferase [Microbacterium sp. CJ88]|uniref:glycosyl transferase n=1 Tax=Microbacterium sp. CJ88 TaxID=3445672 RepID=UPI003F65DF07